MGIKLHRGFESRPLRLLHETLAASVTPADELGKISRAIDVALISRAIRRDRERERMILIVRP